MSATFACETLIPAPREGKLTVSVFRTPEEIGRFETWWRRWQYHPNADPDFFWTIVRSRSQVLYPFVLVVARDGSPEAMLIGRRRSDTK